jgi:hypothetical protein
MMTVRRPILMLFGLMLAARVYSFGRLIDVSAHHSVKVKPHRFGAEIFISMFASPETPRRLRDMETNYLHRPPAD